MYRLKLLLSTMEFIKVVISIAMSYTFESQFNDGFLIIICIKIYFKINVKFNYLIHKIKVLIKVNLSIL